MFFFFFFFNDTATTEIYTLSLHDALPICAVQFVLQGLVDALQPFLGLGIGQHVNQEAEHSLLVDIDRKSTRLNSSHDQISYAVFCLKKKKKKKKRILRT